MDLQTNPQTQTSRIYWPREGFAPISEEVRQEIHNLWKLGLPRKKISLKLSLSIEVIYRVTCKPSKEQQESRRKVRIERLQNMVWELHKNGRTIHEIKNILKIHLNKVRSLINKNISDIAALPEDQAVQKIL